VIYVGLLFQQGWLLHCYHLSIHGLFQNLLYCGIQRDVLVKSFFEGVCPSLRPWTHLFCWFPSFGLMLVWRFLL